MGVGFFASGIVKDKIKARLQKDGSGIFTPAELELAAKKFEAAATGQDLDSLKNEQTQRAKAIEIFQRIQPATDYELQLVSKIKTLYEIA